LHRILVVSAQYSCVLSQDGLKLVVVPALAGTVMPGLCPHCGHLLFKLQGFPVRLFVQGFILLTLFPEHFDFIHVEVLTFPK